MPQPELPHQALTKVSPETARLARTLYQNGMPLADIVRQTGLTARTVYYWIDRDVAADGAVTLKPMPRRRTGRRYPLRQTSVPPPRGKGRTGVMQAGAVRHGIGAVSKAEGISRAVMPRRTGLSHPPRQRLLARLWRTAERQVAEIEGRMRAVCVADGADEAPRSAADSEKDARALALIARTLRELTAAEDEATQTRTKAGDDDSVRDLDDFRRELARRLERLRTDAGGGAALSGEPE